MSMMTMMMTNKRLGPALVFTLILCAHVSGCSGCKKGGATRDLAVNDAAAAAQVKSTRDSGATAELTIDGPPSEFSVVATNVDLKLHRISRSPVLGIAQMSFIYVLSREGSVTPLEPLAQSRQENMGPGMMVGRVSGVWPESVFVEMAEPGGRTETIIENFVVNAAKETLISNKTIGGRKGHRAFAWPWINESILATDCEDASVMGPYLYGRGTDFVIVAGPKPKAGGMPRMPKNASSISGQFIAYPDTGRIFALAGVKTTTKGTHGDENIEVDHSYIWDFADGVHAKSVKLPGEVKDLVRGREERESLAFGAITKKDANPYWPHPKDDAGFLVRFDGESTWVDVKMPFSSEPDVVAVGDDGSVWLANEGKLWRGDFPNLDFKPIALPKDLGVVDLAVRDASDVWITARTGIAKAGEEREVTRTTLLHTQAPKPPIALFSSPDDYFAKLMTQKDPSPYTPACKVPFIIFGSDSEMTERDVLALSKKVPAAFSGSPILGRIKSGKVYGVAVSQLYDANAAAGYRALTGFVASIKGTHPTARLVCTRAIVEKELNE